MTEPTSAAFAAELRTLREQMIAMSGRVVRQLTLATKSLTDRSDDLARDVIRNDEQIDIDEREIDELALQILAIRQPVASDLRFVTTAFKLVIDLERCGDLSCGIARRVLELNRLPGLAVRADISRLSQLVQTNLQTSLDAFFRNDPGRARDVITADAEIDRLTGSAFASLIAHVATDPDTAARVLPLTSVCRYLERVGDHAKNIATAVLHNAALS